MNSDNKIPNTGKQSKEDIAINKKGNQSDGKEINHQVTDKREHNKPRDDA